MPKNQPPKLNYDQAIAMIAERAEEISKSPLFAKAVAARGYKTEEQVRNFGYQLAIATLYGMESKQEEAHA